MKFIKKVIKFIKKIINKINEEITYFTSRKVLDAINNGATYEEVEAIVKEEVYGNDNHKN